MQSINNQPDKRSTSEYKLTPLEKETIILWNEEEGSVYIDTFNTKLINRLNKAKSKCPDRYRVDPPDKYGGVYAEVPKDLFWVAFSSPLSKEERLNRSERMREQRTKARPLPPFEDKEYQ